MSARLPLRIEPFPGEWWLGYLHRVAAFYGVSPDHLILDPPSGFGERRPEGS